jgi:hypothetical protein
MDGYSRKKEPGEVTSGTSKLEIYRQQQRLKYFGFPGLNGNSLNVDGDFPYNDNTKWAIGIFSLAINGKGLLPESKRPKNGCPFDASLMSNGFDSKGVDFINASNAPKWIQITTGTIGGYNVVTSDGKYGTSWTKEILLSAGNNPGYYITDISCKQGGPNAPHRDHLAGMDVDVDPLLSDQWFFKRYPNGLVRANGPNPQGIQVKDGVLIMNTKGTIFRVRPFLETAPLGWVDITESSLINSQDYLTKAYPFLVLQDGYDRIALRENFTTLLNTISTSGTSVELIFWNDP